MKLLLKKSLYILSCMLFCILPIFAEYNPTNPAEPNVYYKISVAASPSNSANVSGIGQYPSGTIVYINCSARSINFVFDHWELNGEIYSTNKSFYYTVGAENVSFVAVFSYNPQNPSEPSTAPTKKVLNLEASPQGSCSFNRTSEEKVVVGSTITITAYANSGYDFLGWYNSDVLVASSLSFSYTMPQDNATLQARFIYNPTNPLEPERFDDTTNVENISVSTNPYRICNGRVFCEDDFRIYNLLGNDVTDQNGCLRGIFILKTTTFTTKVVIK